MRNSRKKGLLSRTEVPNLELTFDGDEDVCWPQIQMDDARFVDELESLEPNRHLHSLAPRVTLLRSTRLPKPQPLVSISLLS